MYRVTGVSGNRCTARAITPSSSPPLVAANRAMTTAGISEQGCVDPPAADILDVDFADGTATDTAQGLPVTEHSDPEISMDPALGRNTATFDGDDALQYPMGEQYAAMADSFSVECVFRYNG